jgi:hypothetical protein
MRRTGSWFTALLGVACLWPATLEGAPCAPSSTALCLSAQRFSVEVHWKDFQGNTGQGQAVPLTADTGYFWFFSATNVELVVKVLDARGLNGHFWVFYGALSNVEYELTVRDTQTGDVRTYDNPSGQFASTGDTLAFPLDSDSLALSETSRSLAPVGAPVDESRIVPSPWESAAACTPTSTALCLSGGRFRLEATWKDFQGNTGAGKAVGLTSDTGYFWFFNSANVEAVVKVLDARPLNDHFWVFYGALSNVEYTLTVTDTVTGIVKTYHNPSALFASVGDTLAFGKPTTFQLIEGAVVKGEIDDETALLYKVYDFFGDARLPQAYRGDPPGQGDHGILFEVSNRWSALSAQTQHALEPFLTPPIYSNSWFAGTPAVGPASLERSGSIAADWTRIETARAAVWYRAADAGAATAANYLAASIETIWDKETELMHSVINPRDPVPDGDQTHNGGDAKLDIYVLPSFRDPDIATAAGATIPYPARTSDQPDDPRAIYILIKIRHASTVESAREVLAHEFFHAIAATFKNGFNGWLNEATATWMEDFVYPTQIHNLEQRDAYYYLAKQEGPPPGGGYKESFDTPNDNGYQDYLFFLYLARRYSPDVNRQIWYYQENMPILKAIRTAIPGGFAQQWPEFAIRCWNHPDVDDFSKWDDLSFGLVEGAADPYIGLASGGGGWTISYSLSQRSVEHLAMNYAFVDVVSDSIKRVEIQNQPAVSGSPFAKTTAWIQLADGSTRVENWTDRPRVVFCRDKASENVEKVLILYTNSGEADAVVWGDGKVIADEIGCGGYRGTARAVTSGRASSRNATVNEIIDVIVKFVPDPPGGDASSRFVPAQITMRYSATIDVDGGCTETIGPVTQTFAGDADFDSLEFDRSLSPPGYSGEAIDGFLTTKRIRCPEGSLDVPSPAGGAWLKIPPGLVRVKPDGSLAGSRTEGATTWTWDLRPD